jgi:hypothetical protein
MGALGPIGLPAFLPIGECRSDVRLLAKRSVCLWATPPLQSIIPPVEVLQANGYLF